MDYFRVNGDYIEKYNVSYDEKRMKKFDKKHRITGYVESYKLLDEPLSNLEGTLAYIIYKVIHKQKNALYEFMNYDIPSIEELEETYQELEEKSNELMKLGKDSNKIKEIEFNKNETYKRLSYIEFRRSLLPLYNEFLELIKVEFVKKYPYKHLLELAELLDIEVENQISTNDDERFKLLEQVKR